MTLFPRFNRLGVALASAGLTAVIFAAVVWIQHARAAWPFSPALAIAAAPTRPVAISASSGSTHDRVPIDAASVGSLDIRLETVARHALTQTVRAVATVVPDESRISHVHTRVSGWVEQLDVNTTGEMVRTGQPLARIFSQELLSSQTEYVVARKNAAVSGITSAVIASGRTRLAVLGMTPDEIDAIERTGEPMRLVSVFAPRSGVVVNRGVTVGTSIDPSTTLLTIADLSHVWILAELPEPDISVVRVGTTAQLDFPASGWPPFGARVEFIFPMLTERTRTLRVRLSAANPSGALRPGLYGTATFQSTGADVITVPRDAVVDTGLQQHVFVATADRFVPRAVTLGVRLADQVEVRQGLEPGEHIVAAGVFLLDSESRLRATGGGTGHHHTAPANDSNAPHAHVSPSTSPDPHAGHRE